MGPNGFPCTYHTSTSTHSVNPSLSLIKKIAEVMVLIRPSGLVTPAWELTREFKDEGPGLQRSLMSHVAIGSSLSALCSHPASFLGGTGARTHTHGTRRFMST